MCTAMTLRNRQGEIFFGRTMDFSWPLTPSLYVVPQGSVWDNAPRTARIRDRYSFLGIGQELAPAGGEQAGASVFFADGVNEAGLAAAALYFPGYAEFEAAPEESALSIGSLDMVRFLLGSFASVSEARSILPSVRIVGIRDSITGTVSPLHWFLCDRSGETLVVERTSAGLGLYFNPAGVLTNSPDFPWHITNLRNYMNVTPGQAAGASWDNLALTPFGQGAGTDGLPGGYAPPARFVRTAFERSHILPPDGTEETVTAGFHILSGVSIPKGVVLTARGEPDYTQYTAFMNTNTGEYFFRTYENSEIVSVNPASGDVAAARNYGRKEPISLGRLVRPVRFWSI